VKNVKLSCIFFLSLIWKEKEYLGPGSQKEKSERVTF